MAGLGSLFGGKKERSAANEARRQQQALIRQMLADAEAAYGPEAAEAAVQKQLEQIAAQQAAAQLGLERNLYARGMGERTPGAQAQTQEAGLLARLASRRDIQTEYPLKLAQARAAAYGATSDYAQQAEQRAGAATALPFDLLGMYQTATANSKLYDYLTGKTSGYQVPPSKPIDYSKLFSGTGLTRYNPTIQSLPLPTYSRR